MEKIPTTKYYKITQKEKQFILSPKPPIAK